MDHVDSSVPGGPQSVLSVVTGPSDPHGPMVTLIYKADPATAVQQTKQAIAAWRQKEMAETVARLRQTDPRWMARLSYEPDSSIARVFGI